MVDFVQFIKQFFSPKKEENKAVPFLHETIATSEEDVEQYEVWKKSERFTRMISFIRMEYRKNLQEENMLGATFYTLDQPSSKGFLLNFRPDLFSTGEFRHFFNYLKEKVLELPYRPSISDSRTYNRQQHVEQIERHYLKPKNNPADETLDQQYGNITIQHVLLDQEPHHIKFICTNYQDKKYHPARDYHKLIEHVLGLKK